MNKESEIILEDLRNLNKQVDELSIVMNKIKVTFEFISKRLKESEKNDIGSRYRTTNKLCVKK